MLRGILFDLDGVIYNADQPLPGAQDTIAWAREQGIPHLFLTNTTSKDRAALVEKLERIGIEVEADDLWTPLAAARQWLHRQPEGRLAAFVRQAAIGELDEFEHVPHEEESGADYVIVGDLGEAWDFHQLNRAFRLLYSNPDAVLIALGRTRYWRDGDKISLDVAPFVAALENAVGREAVTLGKPAKAFFEAAAGKLGVPCDQLLMIGDDVRADVGGAQKAGLRGILVRTGKFQPADLDGDIEPDAVLDSVADLPAWWEFNAQSR